MKVTVISLLASCLLMWPCITCQGLLLCGRQLTDALHMVCQGNYNGPDFRRDVNPQMTAAVAFSNWVLGMDNKRPGETRHLPAYLGNRLRRGVVDECCRKPCTVDVLMSYCG